MINQRIQKSEILLFLRKDRVCPKIRGGLNRLNHLEKNNLLVRSNGEIKELKSNLSKNSLNLYKNKYLPKKIENIC